MIAISRISEVCCVILKDVLLFRFQLIIPEFYRIFALNIVKTNKPKWYFVCFYSFVVLYLQQYS